MKAHMELVILVGLVLTVLQTAHADGGHGWSYSGESAKWSETYGECAGENQSPINIEYTACNFNDQLPDFDVVTDFDETTQTRALNNGHTLVIETTAEILVNGGELPGTYKAAQAHFHWGSTSDQGSEHTVNNQAYPLEMHIVTYNMDRYEVTEGMEPILTSGDDSALAVLGVFFTLAAENNTKLDPLIKHFQELKTSPSEKVLVTGFNPVELLPRTLLHYYRYQGSLTTPTCNEVVCWTLFEEKTTISEYQLEQFRSLLDEQGHPLQDNWRPVQPMNTRQAQRSFQSPSYVVVTDDEDIFDSAIPTCYNLVMVTIMAVVSLLNLFA